MRRSSRILTRLLLAASLVPAAAAYATESNPLSASDDHLPGSSTNTTLVAGYTDHGSWLAAAGATTLIPFESFADGALITTELTDRCITNVAGYSPNASPPGAVGVYVTASGSLPFAMFSAGTLPTEPNFLSNDLSPAGGYATGTITFDMAGPTTAIGAYVADGSPLDNFAIEVFSGGSSVGLITVPPRILPDSFVGIVSSVAFDQAVFYSLSNVDSWGLDNLEHNCTGANGTESSTWGGVKDLFR